MAKGVLTSLCQPSAVGKGLLLGGQGDDVFLPQCLLGDRSLKEKPCYM